MVADTDTNVTFDLTSPPLQGAFKCFRVLTEHESKSKGDPPGTILRLEHWFAAYHIDHVWEAIKLDRLDLDVEVIEIREVAPAIRILTGEIL